MLLEDIVANETYEKRKRRAMDRELWRNWMPSALEKKTNDDD